MPGTEFLLDVMIGTGLILDAIAPFQGSVVNCTGAPAAMGRILTGNAPVRSGNALELRQIPSAIGAVEQYAWMERETFSHETVRYDAVSRKQVIVAEPSQ